jgi:hypothetical protein
MLIVKTVRCVNVSADPVRSRQVWGDQPVEIVAAPGECVEVPEAWARKRPFGGREHPSILDMVAPQLKPCDEPEGQAFLKAQEAEKAAAAPKAPAAPKNAPKAPAGAAQE